MHRISRRLLLAASTLLIGGRALAQDPGFLGTWHGLLDAGAVRLRLTFVIEPGPRARLISLDQRNVAVAASETSIEGDRIVMRFAQLSASFEGRLAGGRIDGRFTQAMVMPLSLGREPVAGVAHPDPPKPAPLTQQSLAAYRAHSSSPGMAAAAAARRGRSLNLADGLRALGQPQPVSTADLWHLGSITKSMTATLVGRAVERGAVKWDDTIGGVLGAALPEMREEYRGITFRHLLSHRSGLPANLDLAQITAFPREQEDPRADRLTYARLALAAAPAGPAEKTFLYSNSGYVVAGAMLEQRMRARWEDLIREHVFEPLGLASAGFGAPGAIGRFDQPVGHATGPNGLAAFPPGGPITDNPAVLGPSGRVHMSLPDLLRYLAAHRDRPALLRPETWDILHRPPFGGDYAMGWMIRPDGLWHNGSNTLWYAQAFFSPGRGIVAAAAANDGRIQIVAPTVDAVLQSAVLAVS